MNRTAILMMLAASGGFAAGAAVEHATSAQKPVVSRVELIVAELAGAQGKEIRMYTTELAPGAITPRHRHPGQYFVYVLEGSGQLEQDGKIARTLSPGSTYAIHDTADGEGSWHTLWNTDPSRRFKSLAVLVTDKGAPGIRFE
jgi:uncharacterized cupin superfamily protein